MNKFKVGDKVKIKEKYGNTYGISEETLEKLKKLKNIWTIESIILGDKICFYTLKEERNGLCFFEDMLEKVNYTYEDLKKSPIGTKVTFENDVILVKTTEKRLESRLNVIRIENLKNLKDDYYGKIIKIEEPAYTTVYESKAEILDEAEKRYLRGVIRHFRDRVKYIQKFTFSTGKAKITIKTEKDNDTWYVSSPLFEKDSMYKNMKPDKEYTLEELGL